MNRQTTRRLGVAVVVAGALAAPGVALASGGPPAGSGGGGGGGGGSTPAPPVINPNPCATAVQSTGGGHGLIFSIGASVTLSYNITNCSAAPETVSTSLAESGVGFSQDSLNQAPCATTALWSAGSFTIQPRSTQGFSTAVPTLTCPFDSQNDGVTLTVLAAPSGSPLATATGGFQLLPVTGLRGG